MKALILINAFYSFDEYFYQPNRLKEEFEKKGVSADIKRNNEFSCIIENDSLKCELNNYDFCVYLDKDKYILQALAYQGIPLYNSLKSISVCDDKMLTYLKLANSGVRMPKTLPGLLCYNQKEVITENTILKIEKELSYPLIIKESFGSLGKGVYLVKNREELLEVLEKVKCKPYLIQEFIDSSFGRDIRVLTIGNKAVGGMMRISNSDFRSNLAQGGKSEVVTLTDEMKFEAEKVSKILGLDYCAIDFLFGKDNSLVLCEVNSNAFFCGFEKCTKINVAALFVEHILKSINKIITH